MASKEQSIILITGANSGIGFALAAQLVASPSNFVLLGSRSLAKGLAAVHDLQAQHPPGGVAVLPIDVSSSSSVHEAAASVRATYGRLDALVNNAAIASGDASASLGENLTAAFLTNATGPAVVVDAFAPLLAASERTPRIVNVTSGAGSITMRSDATNPHQKMKVIPYRASKSALNMITACQAYEYGPQGWKVFCFCPGFTVSNLGPQNREEYGAKPTSEGAAPIVEILAGDRDAEHGGFLKAGGQWPW